MPVLILFALVLLGVRPAAAHQTSLKYVELRAGPDLTVDVTIRFTPSDVTEAMGLPADARPPLAAAVEHPAVPPFVMGWIEFPRCTNEDPRAQLADANFIAVTFRLRCLNVRELRTDFTPFFALDTRHEAIVRMTWPDLDPLRTVVRASEPRVTLRAQDSTSVLAWIVIGMEHIYGGLDHILFVVALLLVVMLVPGSDRQWQLRAFVPMLRSMVVVITAFTIGHSLTLVAAALDLIVVPSGPIEALIALSIAYTAAEDVVNPAARWRFWLTFGFGLVHGFGFASQLVVLLPPQEIVVPLLCFNLGVEIGQLSIVLVVLPVLFALARKLGGQRYRRVALPILATPIFLLGIAMVIERVAGIQLLPM